MKLNTDYLLLIIIALLLLYYFHMSKEKFNSSGDIDNVISMEGKQLMNILPFFNNNGYIATFTTQDGLHANNLIYTTELRSGNWKGPMKNGLINDRSIIVDLSYDIDKRLMAVGMELVNNEPVYTIYKKDTDSLDSIWAPIMSNSKTIRSVSYDLNGTMLGISSFDGQLYKNRAGKWLGPINYDNIPMKKVYFDTDRIMLGIGLADNKIYKKTSLEWDKSVWNKEDVNHRRVMDIVFDDDGKLIATTSTGIEKQKHNVYISTFNPLGKVEKGSELLTKKEILTFRTGIDFEEYSLLEDDTKLGQNLNNLLRFKKKSIDVCKNKKKSFTKLNATQIIKQNENENIVNEIDNILSELRGKGY
jgi:hypothetical protein